MSKDKMASNTWKWLLIVENVCGSTHNKEIWIICPGFCMVEIGSWSIVLPKSIERSLSFSMQVWFDSFSGRQAGVTAVTFSCWTFIPDFVKLKGHSKMKCFYGTLHFPRRLYFESFSGQQAGVTVVIFLAWNDQCTLSRSCIWISLWTVAGLTVVTFLAGRRNAARYFTFSPHTTSHYTRSKIYW